MIDADPKDFTVNLEKRTATHKSGVVFTFHRYVNEEDWAQAEPDPRNDTELFEGDSQSLSRTAKAAALAAGMKRQ